MTSFGSREESLSPVVSPRGYSSDVLAMLVSNDDNRLHSAPVLPSLDRIRRRASALAGRALSKRSPHSGSDGATSAGSHLNGGDHYQDGGVHEDLLVEQLSSLVHETKTLQQESTRLQLEKKDAVRRVDEVQKRNICDQVYPDPHTSHSHSPLFNGNDTSHSPPGGFKFKSKAVLEPQYFHPSGKAPSSFIRDEPPGANMRNGGLTNGLHPIESQVPEDSV